MILSKAEVRASQFPEAVDHESRACEECQRQGKLNHDEGPPHSKTAAAGLATPAFLQCIAQIQADVRLRGYRKRRQKNHNHLQQHRCETHAQSAANDCQGETLGKELGEKLPPCCTERSPDS